MTTSRTSRAKVALALVLPLAFLQSGCTVTSMKKATPTLRSRAVFLEQDGEAVPMRKESERAPTWKQEYDLQLSVMMDSIRANPADSGIMIVVHGGLIPLKGSEKESARLGERIRAAGFNPIFINWRSDFFDSYFEHLFRVRQGQVRALYDVDGVLAAPFFLLSDLGRGISRWPITAAAQAADGVKNIDTKPTSRKVSEYLALQKDFGSAEQVQVSLGSFCRLKGDYAKAAWKIPFFPARIAVAPASDAFGTSAWDNMNRRTYNLFRQPWESAERDTANGERWKPGEGGASILMDSIAQLLASDKAAGRPVRRITLVGHSMGTIVLNELIRTTPTIEYHDIVYMGAATSIREFLEKVVPYLEQHPKTRFYNLMLHPAVEAREQHILFKLFPLAPGGSLLEYIDDYYSKPATHIDRTLGKWVNVIETTHLIPTSVRGRVTLKAFGYNDPRAKRFEPRKHGEFNDEAAAFWERSFWEADRPRAGGTQNECSRR